MRDVVSDRVECHSGYEYAERPVALWWEEHKLTITNIEAEWRTPEHHYFRIRVQDERCFELSYDECHDEWHTKPI